MTYPTISIAPTTPVSPSAPETTLSTRFGPVAVDAARLITFSGGLLGFARHECFLLTEVPGRDVAFKLLQAADDPELGFLVLPLDRRTGPIARADLEAAATRLGFAADALAVLAVITLKQEADGVRCTVNLRAPLLIDTERRIGCQHVLASDAYAVRAPLPLGPTDGR